MRLLPIQEAMQSREARPGRVKRGFMSLRTRMPTKSMMPKSVNRLMRKEVPTISVRMVETML